MMSTYSGNFYFYLIKQTFANIKMIYKYVNETKQKKTTTIFIQYLYVYVNFDYYFIFKIFYV